jgi:hypothetical protein
MSSMPRVGSEPIWDDPADFLPPEPPPDAGAPAQTPTCPQVAAPRGTPGPADLGAHQGLPDVLFQSPDATVQHGTDPGNFYCEHIFYASQREADRPGSSVATNAFGERLAGFLHVPDDAWTSGGGGSYAEADRHRGTREVVGAALRGYFDDIAAAPGGASGPVRILLTGFGPFDTIRNNPTGDFVSHRENLDAAMRAAFGANLLTPVGTRTAGTSIGAGETFTYRVRDPATGNQRQVQIRAEQLAVADGSLDPASAGSIERAYAAFRPQAAISLGVAPDSRVYLAEHHADEGGMRPTANGGFRHEDGAPEDAPLPDNYSLARAILRGAPSPT